MSTPVLKHRDPPCLGSGLQFLGILMMVGGVVSCSSGDWPEAGRSVWKGNWYWQLGTVAFWVVGPVCLAVGDVANRVGFGLTAIHDAIRGGPPHAVFGGSLVDRIGAVALQAGVVFTTVVGSVILFSGMSLVVGVFTSCGAGRPAADAPEARVVPTATPAPPTDLELALAKIPGNWKMDERVAVATAYGSRWREPQENADLVEYVRASAAKTGGSLAERREVAVMAGFTSRMWDSGRVPVELRLGVAARIWSSGKRQVDFEKYADAMLEARNLAKRLGVEEELSEQATADAIVESVVGTEAPASLEYKLKALAFEKSSALGSRSLKR